MGKGINMKFFRVIKTTAFIMVALIVGIAILPHLTACAFFDEDESIPDEVNLAVQMNKIPVANSQMTEEELRDIVVQFMKLQLTFAYKVDLSGSNMNSYSYYIKNLYSKYGGEQNLDNLKIYFHQDKYYGGVPYMGNAAGSVYRWLEYYNAKTGKMDFTPIISTDRLNWTSNEITYPNVGSPIFGNSCASACVWAYSRVSNSISTFWTSTLIPQNGFLKVGNYQLTENNDHGTKTSTICKDNGKTVMFDSYAKMKKADGLVQSGHAVMIVDNPDVVYNQDGSINEKESYVLVAEQKASFLNKSPANGGVDLYSPLKKRVTYRVMGNYPGLLVNGVKNEMKWSFEKLYNEGYLPFTVPELVGQAPVTTSDINFSYQGENITIAQIKESTISCNYPISDLHITLKDEEGKVIFTGMYCKSATDLEQLKSVAPVDALTKNVLFENKKHIENTLSSNKNKNYKIELTCRVSTGEMLTAYSGTLIG